MSVIFVANVGNRDVAVDKSAPIPGEVNPHWNPGASRRALGTALQNAWPECEPHVQLPIIGKAVDYVTEAVGPIDCLVLVFSDQSGQDGVAENHLAQDTCELAPIVERLLVQRHRVDSTAVWHWPAVTHPADYGEMQEYFRTHLVQLKQIWPSAECCLEVSGGTPAMTSMLLTVGAQVFGLDARPLYISEHEDQPFHLDLGRRTVAESLMRVVREDVKIGAYHAAVQTVQSNRDLLEEFVPVSTLLAALEHGWHRRNFDLDAAWNAVERARGSEWFDRLRILADGTNSPSHSLHLAGIVDLARMSFRNGDYFDFIVRVFQFVEGAWRELALALGAEFEQKGMPCSTGKDLAADWSAANPDVMLELDARGVRCEVVNRYVLQNLVEILTITQGKGMYHDTTTLLHRLEQIAGLRNDVVHQYRKVTLELLRDTFYSRKRDRKRRPPEDAVDIVAAMEDVWRALAGRSEGPENAYESLNTVIFEMIGD